MKKLFVALCLILFFSIGIAQTSDNQFESNKGFFSVSAGFMYNQPTKKSARNDKIRYNFVLDLNIDIGYTYLHSKNSGWMFNLGSSTKNYRYSMLDQSNHYQGPTSTSLEDYYYRCTVKKSYNIRLAENIKGVLAAGPVLMFNAKEFISDSIRQSTTTPEIVENTRAIGAGLEMYFAIEIETRKNRHAFISFSYQKGFIDFRKITIVNQHFNYLTKTFYFNGSGPAIRFGIAF